MAGSSAASSRRKPSARRSAGAATTTAALFVLALLLLSSTAHAGKSCSKSKLKKVNACVKEAYAEEEALPKGPCYSEDWDCVCRMQQGLIDCWELNGCEDASDANELRAWNKGNCAGQHGVSNTAAGGDLTFDLSLVKSASGSAPEPTATTKKKDHRKHKHHASTADADSTSSTAAAAAATGKAAAPFAQASSSSSSTPLLQDDLHPYGSAAAPAPSSSNGNYYVAPASGAVPAAGRHGLGAAVSAVALLGATLHWLA